MIRTPDLIPDGRPVRSGRIRFALLALVGFVVVPLVYVAAVLTSTGQRLEDAALGGVRGSDLFGSDTALNVISAPVLVLLALVIVAVAFARHRLSVGLAAVIVIAGATGTSTLFKRIAARPDIAGSTTPNSFPSGHATIALAAMIAVLMVTPRRYRPVIMLAGTAYAVIVANQTVVFGWHRVSDIVGACGVVLFWAGIVRLVGPRVDRGQRGDRDAAPGPRRLVTLLLSAAAAASAVALVVATVVVLDNGVESDRSALLVAGRMGASLAVLLTVLSVWFADGLHHGSRGGAIRDSAERRVAARR